MRDFIRFRTPNCSYSLPLLTFILLSGSIISCTSDPQNRPSPLRLDSGMIGDIKVKVEFSSPAVRDREIFGTGSDFLVEFNELWRTGANDASFITVEDFLFIDTTRLDSGSYSIFTIPNDTEWLVIFNKEWKQWGSYNYKDSLDILRMKVPVKRLIQPEERMRFFFQNDSLKFEWDNVSWGVLLSTLP